VVVLGVSDSLPSISLILSPFFLLLPLRAALKSELEPLSSMGVNGAESGGKDGRFFAESSRLKQWGSAKLDSDGQKNLN
jgi:hypothetical protein